MITFFTSCCPFKKERNIIQIQRNAIQSWMQLDCEIILMGTESGTAEIAKEFGIIHEPEVQYSEFGVPLINSMFRKAEEIARYNPLCYINADIILMSDFLPAIQRVKERFQQFLVVGQRRDTLISEVIDFNDTEWEKKVLKVVKERGRLHASCGIDYFVFTKGLWGNIPDLSLARATFDDWLMWYPVSEKMVTVDATSCIVAVHQNHTLSGHPPEGFEKNKAIAKGRIANITHSKWILTKDSLIRREK